MKPHPGSGRPRSQGESPYLPIAEHGLIGDLHTAALVGSEGTIDWYCCPRFDSPSVFASILDAEKGGFWAVHPDHDDWLSRQLYLPDTNVLLTRFSSPEGVVELADFMPVAEQPSWSDEQRHRLVRRVTAIRGHLRMHMQIEPRFDYARADHSLHSHEHGFVFESENLVLGLSTDAEMARTESGGLESFFSLGPGESRTFVLDRLEPDEPLLAIDAHGSQQAFDETAAYWRNWLGQSTYRGRWREMVNRSALTLKLLTYRPTGAIVAAVTAGLPEQLGGVRNWDYRYTWIRDAAFSLYALLHLGFHTEAGAFMSWLTDRVRDGVDSETGPLQVMYGIDGRTELPEEILPHLEGYRGSAPVRIGNAAVDQLQLDIYGELIDSVYLYNKGAEPLHWSTWQDVLRMVTWLCDHWDQPDEGIWETRGGRQYFTHSRLMSWVALERAMRIARQRGLPGDLVHWGRCRDEIYHQIMDRGWHEDRGAFVQHYDTDVLDAAVLLMPLVKFISPTDPRWLSTLDAMDEELVSDSLVYRYNPEASPDGLEGDEGTFSICSFWYVEALTRAGRLEQARLAFEKMLTYANHLGLYAEEIGPTGEQLGNFPQAFTHLALISAATNLDRALG